MSTFEELFERIHKSLRTLHWDDEWVHTELERIQHEWRVGHISKQTDLGIYGIKTFEFNSPLSDDLIEISQLVRRKYMMDHIHKKRGRSSHDDL